jgi:hypothetical protein
VPPSPTKYPRLTPLSCVLHARRVLGFLLC